MRLVDLASGVALLACLLYGSACAGPPSSAATCTTRFDCRPDETCSAEGQCVLEMGGGGPDASVGGKPSDDADASTDLDASPSPTPEPSPGPDASVGGEPDAPGPSTRIYALESASAETLELPPPGAENVVVRSLWRLELTTSGEVLASTAKLCDFQIRYDSGNLNPLFPPTAIATLAPASATGNIGVSARGVRTFALGPFYFHAGWSGAPSGALPDNPQATLVRDQEMDGLPGITAKLLEPGRFDNEDLYLAIRSRFDLSGVLSDDARLDWTPSSITEISILDATFPAPEGLVPRSSSPNVAQNRARAVRLDSAALGCSEIIAQRATLFP